MRLWPRHAITRLRLRPGDVVVLTVPDECPLDEAQRLGDRVKATFPNHPVLVTSEEMQIRVVRVEPDPVRGYAKAWPVP